MFKTLVAQVDGALTVGVVPVGSRLDLKALAAAAGGRKAAMADPADAERATGYVVGGISPLGLRKRLPVVIDSSALGFGTIFCSGGRRGLEIEIAPWGPGPGGAGDGGGHRPAPGLSISRPGHASAAVTPPHRRDDARVLF